MASLASASHQFHKISLCHVSLSCFSIAGLHVVIQRQGRARGEHCIPMRHDRQGLQADERSLRGGDDKNEFVFNNISQILNQICDSWIEFLVSNFQPSKSLLVDAATFHHESSWVNQQQNHGHVIT